MAGLALAHKQSGALLFCKLSGRDIEDLREHRHQIPILIMQHRVVPLAI
jgi:hypothetical protein